MRIFFVFILLSLFQISDLAAKKGEYCPKQYEHELAVCAIFQNEADYLKEWIEFHKLVGIQHFYLYNHLSQDHFREVLFPYIESGEVELFDWEDHYNSKGNVHWPLTQTSAYNHAVQLAKKRVKWLAIIDIDEFLFPVEEDSLADFLLAYEGETALCVNWQMYGTSGVAEIAPGHLLIEDLIYKAPTDYGENVHVKSIVRPQWVETVKNPHYCKFLYNSQHVNSNHEPRFGAFSNILVDKVRINHYWTRDEKFFYERKIGRREKWGDGSSIARANMLNEVVDTAIHKHVQRLREKLFCP